MDFKNKFKNLEESIKLIESLEEYSSKLSFEKYDRSHEELNNKLQLLYIKYYQEHNISYYEMSILKNYTDKDRNIFIQKRKYLINKLNQNRIKIMNIKEVSYPWPWNETIFDTDSELNMNKNNIEFKEIEYVKKISLDEYHIQSYR